MTAIVSPHGELLFTIYADDYTVQLNTPQGCVAVDDPEDKESYYEDGDWIPFPEKPSPFHTFNYETRLWVDERTLDEAKAAKWSEIKSQRDVLEASGFEFEGNIYDSDLASQGRITAAAALGVDVEWTLQDNTTVWLDHTKLGQLQVALAAHVTSAHTRGRAARIAIEQATTLSEVDAVVL